MAIIRPDWLCFAAMNEKVATIPSVVIERVVRGRAAVDMLLVIGASALIAISAQVAMPLPFTPVPLTLQPLAVIFIGAALGATRGAAAAALYLLEGFRDRKSTHLNSSH